jgi:hypothetical protein
MGSEAMSIEAVSLEAHIVGSEAMSKEAMSSGVHIAGSEAHIGLEALGSSSDRASSFPLEHTGRRIGSPIATHQSSSRHPPKCISNSHHRLRPRLLPRPTGTIARTSKPTTPTSNNVQGDGGR